MRERHCVTLSQGTAVVRSLPGGQLIQVYPAAVTLLRRPENGTVPVKGRESNRWDSSATVVPNPPAPK